VRSTGQMPGNCEDPTHSTISASDVGQLVFQYLGTDGKYANSPLKSQRSGYKDLPSLGS